MTLTGRGAIVSRGNRAVKIHSRVKTSALNKKGPKRFSFRPLFGPSDRFCDMPSWLPDQTSALPRRLGFIDRLLMIPAAAADGLVDGRRRALACELGFAEAATAERRTTPGRELIDLCRPVIQICAHCNSP